MVSSYTDSPAYMKTENREQKSDQTAPQPWLNKIVARKLNVNMVVLLGKEGRI